MMSDSHQGGISNPGYVATELDEIPPPSRNSTRKIQQQQKGQEDQKLSKIDELSTNDDHSCSLYGIVKLPFLNFFLTPTWILVLLCMAAAIQGIVVNGIVNVSISTLERRFGLQSTTTGIIAGCYDIGSLVTVIPISYFGGRLGASKPKYIAIGLLIMGTGSFVFSLPHFISSRYNVKVSNLDQNATDLCQSENELHYDCSNKEKDAEELETLANFKYYFIFAHALHGIGAAPLITLGTTLLDESVSKKSSPLFIGTFQTMFVVGPALGYVIGSRFLNLHTDIDVIPDDEEIFMTPDSQLWVGAWWIGFIMSWLMAWFCAALIGLYPASLPGAGKHNQVKPSDGFGSLKELPIALKSLIKNPTYMSINFGGSMDAFFIACMATFAPKFVQYQYGLPASLAALFVGMMVVPAGGCGTFLGGYLTKRLKLTRSGVIRMYMWLQILVVPFTFGFLFYCPGPEFPGVNSWYTNEAETLKHPIQSLNAEILSRNLTLSSSCNSDCFCSEFDFQPVCGADNRVYFNPCFAGCLNKETLDTTNYTDCSCVLGDNKIVSSQSCQSGCLGQMIGFVITGLGVILFTFMSAMPNVVGTLRAVEPVHRSLALGLESIFTRVLGTIPGPIIFGFLIDKACILWQRNACDENLFGSCLTYDNFNMALYLMIVLLVVKAFAVFFFALALYFSKRSHIPDEVDSQL